MYYVNISEQWTIRKKLRTIIFPSVKFIKLLFIDTSLTEKDEFIPP